MNAHQLCFLVLGNQQWLSVIFARAGTIGGDFEASEFNTVLSQYELLRFKRDSIISASFKPMACLKEALFNIVSP